MYWVKISFLVHDLPTSIYDHQMLPSPVSNGVVIIHHSGIYQIQCNNGGCQGTDWKQTANDGFFSDNVKIYAAVNLPKCVGK